MASAEAHRSWQISNELTVEMQRLALPTPFSSTCQLCWRVYTEENSYSRHVKYCQRAQAKRKGRPRSCVACSRAKAKCSFATPCSRCEARGEECFYNVRGQRRSVATVPRAQPSSYLSMGNRPITETHRTGFTFGCDAEQLITLDPETTDRAIFGQVEGQPQTSTLNEWASDEPPDFGSCFLLIRAHAPDEGVIQQMASKDLTRLSYQSPTLKQAARLIVQALSAFPQMMLRRETFPPFIHPYWHQQSLPEKLASCMSISQLFVSRTPDTRPFLWRVIEAEEMRFRNECESLSALELQPAVQAMIIYMIMAIIDQDTETPSRGERMLQTTQLLCSRFLGFVGSYSSTEQAEPSSTWESWVFSESRRR
ncbi:hypothetical protein B0T10DRAFT_493834 [Thelonectria olida]|uniref:Zn(2)-C6 fungal-type domain-containing protein n=1 Tax=Thelonectria olida TaxID=1576542 RepID=A0A9P8VY04_9HYPO|nr:hypothetical protein B0T10DRAFT_493834 [Thelonectria olida]